MVGAQTENETGTQEELDILYIKMAQEKPRKEHKMNKLSWYPTRQTKHKRSNSGIKTGNVAIIDF